VSIIIFIAFAALLDSVWQYVSQWIGNTDIRSVLFGALVIAVVALRFDIGLLKEKHSTTDAENSYSQMLVHNKAVFQSLNLPDNAVLFNVKGRHYIEAMFYTGVPAYNFIPTFKQYQDLIAKGQRIAIIRPENSELPTYLLNDPAIIIINRTITGYD